jgi:hypothetical protein
MDFIHSKQTIKAFHIPLCILEGVLWIRIWIGSGSRMAKMAHKNRKVNK